MHPPGKAHVALALSVAFFAACTAAPCSAQGPYYYVVNSTTRMMVEVLAQSMDVGAPVVLWPHYGGTSQQFTVQLLEGNRPYQPRAERWFLLRARHSDRCLKTAGYQSGAPLVQAVCSGDASQMWRVRTVTMTPAECPSGQCFGGSRRLLENYYDRGRRCLDAANGRFPAPPPQGAALQAWDCIARFTAPNAVNQSWELIRIEDWGARGPIVR